jgi:hypothetical protein
VKILRSPRSGKGIVRFSRFHALLITGLLAALVVTTPEIAAQDQFPAADPLPAQTGMDDERYLDRKVTGFFGGFHAARAEFRESNFTAYLAIVAAVSGLSLGVLFALLAYRFSDPMSPYRVIRRSTSLLALACGAGLGVFVAVLQVSPDVSGRVTLLLLAIGCGGLAAWLSALAGFILHRICSTRKARRLGKHLTQRMRHG